MSYKWWLVIAIFLFGVGLVLGLASPASIAGLLAEDVAVLEELAGFLASLPKLLVLVVIFIKNISALLISLVFSPILCLAPVLALTVNGWVLGWVSAAVIKEQSLGFLLAGILPHGIFELPAFIMGEAVALSVGTAVILALFKEERRSLLLPHLKQNLRYFLVAIVLLLPAAIIETYVTPLFLG